VRALSGLIGIALLTTAGTASAKRPQFAPAADATSTAGISLPITGAIVRSSKDDTDVAIQASKAWTSGGGGVAAGGKISGPLRGSTTKLATLDGLGDSTTLELSVSVLRWTIGAPDANKMAEACRKYVDANECKLTDLPTRTARRDFDQAVNYGHPLLLRVGGRMGYRSIDYLDDQTLAAGSVNIVPWSVFGGAGVVFPSVAYVGVGYRREHAIGAEDPSEVCRPVAQTGASTCADAVVGRPRITNRNILSAEARTFIGPFGSNPSVNVDLSNRVTGVQVPLYFAHDDEGGLIAGVTPSWRSDTKDFSAFLFIGGTLDLVPDGMIP
jgi:hypothetical protein